MQRDSNGLNTAAHIHEQQCSRIPQTVISDNERETYDVVSGEPEKK